MPKVHNYRRQTVQKTAVPKHQMPKPPEMPAKPGKQDKICMALFAGGLIFSVALLFGSAFAISQTALQAVQHKPVEWLTLVGMTVLTVLLGFVLRGLIWASFAGVTMLSAHLQAFHAQDKISRIGLKLKNVLPGGAAWAVQTIMGQMASKQQYKEMIAFGTSEYEAAKKKDQTLAPVCAYLGMAHQIQGDPHAAILWNERAVEMFAKAMEPLEKAEAKTKVTNRDFVDSIIVQYASAYANLASNYFSVNNHGKAKKNFQLALEQLQKAKDGPQKDMLVRGINEHLARLKHW